MSKELLNESMIRKFMKLANIEPLADNFLQETSAGLADKGAVSGKSAMGSSTHPDHRNKKAKPAGLASQGPGLVKEEEDDDKDLEERLTNEIARRVAARLVKESRQEKMADQLAERIMGRLTAKK